MFKSLLSIWLVVFVSLCCKSTLGQEANIVQFSIPEGLPQSQVNKIIFDSRGMLWVATSGGGIASFDGQNFLTFDESEGLAGNIVSDIEEDTKGRIISVSSWGGVTIINHNEIEKVIPYPDDLTEISSIEKDAYGTLWIGGSKIGYLKDDELVFIETDLTLPFNNAVNLKCFGDQLFITSNNKLIIVDVQKKKQIYSKTYDFVVNVVLPISDKTWYLGSENSGLFVEKSGELSAVDLPLPDGNKTITITDGYAESIHNLWFTSRNGVYQIENNQIEYFEKNKGMNHFDCSTICFDAQDNVWFGTRGEGVIGIVNTPFNYFFSVEGLNKSDNFPIYEDEFGRIWVGNNEEGLYIFDGGKVKNLTVNEGLPDNKIRSLVKGFGNTILVGTGKGLAKVEIESLKITNIEEFSGAYVKGMFKYENNIFVGTLNNGLYKLDTTYNVIRLFGDQISSISSVNVDQEGNLLIGNGAGFHRQDGINLIFTREGLVNSYVGNITVDYNGKIWVGTDREIGRYDGETFTSFSEKEGLTSGLVYILYSDSNGYLWVGTNKGLDRITLDHQSEIVKIKHFGYAEGFKGIEVNAKGVFENQNKEIYFSTISGIHKYSPSYDFSYSYNTPVYIQGVKLFLEDYDFSSKKRSLNWFDVPESMTLAHDQNHLTFEFFAVDYLNPKGVEYTYFLEGFDKKWSPPTSNRSAMYNHIPPGNYVFHVKQANNEFSKVATLKIYIQKPPPPFYRTVWFALIILALFTLVIYYFTEYRTSKLRNQQIYLESKIEERTLEILESEKEKTILLQEVHHRVKNNLQIIISLFRLQSHFTDNEEALDLFRNSQNRIRSMSKIHEKLYETKDLSKIEIRSYIIELVHDLVESYDINNEVVVNHKIDECNISLDELTPLALVINEIITNSLKYGLKDVDFPEVKVVLTQNEVGYTQLIISDNGPGFDPAIWEDHNSMGVELIKTLTEQLDGEIKLSFDQGHPVYILKFKATV